MTADPGNALITVVNALGLVLATLSLGVSGAVYFLSRAGKIRSFENRVYAQLTNANARIESIESQWLQTKTEITALADEMVTISDKTAKERRRLYAEHQRADVHVEKNGGQEVEITSLPRAEQLARVRASLRGG